MPSPVFISYSHQDKAFVDQLCDGLSHMGVEFFRDQKAIKWGDDIFTAVQKGLDQCAAIIVVVSPASLKSNWVPFELGHAVAKKKKILPLLTHPALDPPDYLSGLSHLTQIPEALAYFESTEWNQLALKLPSPKTPQQISDEAQQLHKMQREWDSLSDLRQTFWETLSRHYEASYSGKASYPDTLTSLVDRANPSHGLPLSKDEEFIHYPMTHGRHLTGFDSVLYRFCNEVYPAKKLDKSLKEISALADESFDAFHSARKIMAKFWNDWGNLIYQDTISFDKIVRTFAPHYRVIKLLSYLEVSLEQWTQDPGWGKEWLFSVNTDWERAPRLT